jgi:hypothetical protein
MVAFQFANVIFFFFAVAMLYGSVSEQELVSLVETLLV